MVLRCDAMTTRSSYWETRVNILDILDSGCCVIQLYREFERIKDSRLLNNANKDAQVSHSSLTSTHPNLYIQRFQLAPRLQVLLVQVQMLRAVPGGGCCWR